MFTEIRVDRSICKELLLNDKHDGLFLPRRSSSRWGSSWGIRNDDRHRLDINLIFQFFIVLDCLFESSSFVKSLLFILSLFPLYISSFFFLIQRRRFCIFGFWFAFIYFCQSLLRLSIFWFFNSGLSIRLWALKVLRICREVSLIRSLKQRLYFIFDILLFVSTIRVIEKQLTVTLRCQLILKFLIMIHTSIICYFIVAIIRVLVFIFRIIIGWHNIGNYDANKWLKALRLNKEMLLSHIIAQFNIFLQNGHWCLFEVEVIQLLIGMQNLLLFWQFLIIFLEEYAFFG